MKRLPDPPLACPDVRERLPLFVGADLDTDVLEAVASHLRLCAGCRAEEARAREARERFTAALDDSLRTLPRAGLWPAVRAQLLEEGLLPAPQPLARPQLAPRAVRRWAPLLAAAAAVALVFVVLDPFGRQAPALPAGSPAPTASTASTAGAVPLLPVASGGLRRVAPGEEALLQQAEPLRRGRELGPVRPHQLSEPALVNYR